MFWVAGYQCHMTKLQQASTPNKTWHAGFGEKPLWLWLRVWPLPHWLARIIVAICRNHLSIQAIGWLSPRDLTSAELGIWHFKIWIGRSEGCPYCQQGQGIPILVSYIHPVETSRIISANGYAWRYSRRIAARNGDISSETVHSLSFKVPCVVYLIIPMHPLLIILLMYHIPELI